jgi:ADP-ribose pyrophosphatase YjhB (NUDIX family)
MQYTKRYHPRMNRPADARAANLAFFAGGDRSFLPHVSVDCVILGFHGGELKVLLVRWAGSDAWSLPGGFVRQDEPLDRAAERVLRERTGLDRLFLQQFHAFGGTDRREAALLPVFQALGVAVPPDHWILRRVVSVAYVALVDFVGATPTPDALSEECRWWDLHDRPPLLFDHDAIVAGGLETVRARLAAAQPDAAAMAASLLPERFTMPELQRLYEAVLGRALDRRNFQKTILERGLVVRSPASELGVRQRARFLYQFAARP